MSSDRAYQRKHTREEVDRAIVAVFRTGGSSIEARVLDRSEGGLGVEVPEEVAGAVPGSDAEFELTIRSDDGQETRRARVAWSRTVGRIKRAGIEFLGGKH